MGNSVYKINKGINKPIEFRGLKAQYILYLAIGLLFLLILFALLYVVGVNMFICLGIMAVLGTVLFTAVYQLSAKYGQHGLTKKLASRRVPVRIRITSRNVFLSLGGKRLTAKS
jgi:hypothetical protein